MSRTIFREAKRRGRRIPRSGVRHFVAGHFVAVIGSRIFSRENTTTSPTLMGGVRFTANRGHCQYDILSQVNVGVKKAVRNKDKPSPPYYLEPLIAVKKL